MKLNREFPCSKIGVDQKSRAESLEHPALSGSIIMKLPRRQFLHLAAGASALSLMSHIAGAQAYPTRSVRLVVGFPAGGANDIYARLIAEWLSERFGRSFIVENRPGAASNIATEAVARAPADGYTLLEFSTDRKSVV